MFTTISKVAQKVYDTTVGNVNDQADEQLRYESAKSFITENRERFLELTLMQVKEISTDMVDEMELAPERAKMLYNFIYKMQRC